MRTKPNFRILPWARSYTEARLRDYHCVYSTTRTAERERQLELTQLSELHEWKVGSFREDAVGDYVASKGINVLRAPTERENMARLSAGLLDVIVTGRATGEYLAKELELAIEYLFTFYYAPLYLCTAWQRCQ
nr:hypothetical protein [uncultured Halomonas sp.]